MDKSKHFAARYGVGARVIFLVLLSLIGGVLFYASQANAAADLQNGCYDGVAAQDGVTAGGILKSPFGSTPDVCLGMETNSGYFFQLAVIISDGDVSKSPQVTAVDNAGNKIPMKQDTRNTLFVSAVPVHGNKNSVGICDETQKITVTVTLNGTAKARPPQAICTAPNPSGFAHDTWINTIDVSSAARQFVGYIGINYGKAYTVDANSQYHVLQQNGIETIKITGGNCATQKEACELSNASKTLHLTDGSLIIDASTLTPAVPYKIELSYNARAVDNNMPYDEWTDHTFTFDQVVLNPTGDTLITPEGYSAESPAYYDKDNKPGAKETSGDNSDSGNAAPTCTIEGIGWIVCPVTTFLGNIADGTINILNDFFKVPAKNIFDTNGEAYKYWQQIRNYANIMFVIAFLIIIFSQITGAGITNYGIKKLLPKLIATALLVNLSFIICALLVDASNLLGYSLASLLGNSITNGTGDASSANAWAQGNLFGGIVSSAIVLGTVLAAAYFALAAVISVVISVVIIGVTMVILLGIRQALIILLVVIAPLAFVALLLPNTEGLFKKWLKLFKSLLLIFPIASLLYGAGGLASRILLHSTDNMIVQVIGAALPVVMLVAIYKVFNSAMNALEGVGGFVNGIRGGIGKAGQKVTGASDKAIQNSTYGQFRNYREREASRRRALIQGGTYNGKGGKWNPRNWGSSAHKAYNDSKYSGNFGNQLTASGAAVVNAQDDEYLKNAGARIDGLQYTDSKTGKIMTLDQAQMMAIAIGGGDIKDSGGQVILKRSSIDGNMQRAAVQRAAKIATVKDAEKLATATSSASMSASMRKTISESLAQSSVLAKAPHLAGAPLGDMQKGTFDLQKAARDAVSAGKIKPENLVNLDENSAKTILDAVTATPSGSSERKQLSAAAKGVYKPGSMLTDKIVDGSGLDTHLKNMQSL